RVPGDKARQQAAKEILSPPHYGSDPEPMSLRQAAEHIRRHFMIELKQAPFSRGDAELSPSAGACTTCPKMTGNNRAEFPDSRADMCTDPDCFAGKQKAWSERVKEQALAAGRKVLSKQESEKLFYNTSLVGNAPYVDLADQCW